MIRYLTHEKIDKAKWDECIRKSLNSLLYAYSWYLDEAAPGWDALVLGEYDAVFPLTHKRKYFIRYLYQPLFTQQLGLFYRNLPGSEKLAQFISAIPSHFRYMDIALNEGNHPEPDLGNFARRKNYVLDLDKSYAKLAKNYNEGTRRNIAKSKKNDLLLHELPYQDVVAFYRKHKGRETLHVTQRDYTRLERIAGAVNKNSSLKSWGVYDGSKLIAAGLFALHTGRMIYMMGASSFEGRDKRAMYLLLDHMIQEHCNRGILLDFEGSNIPGIAQFFKGFGAKKQLYTRLKMNRLPAYLKWLRK